MPSLPLARPLTPPTSTAAYYQKAPPAPVYAAPLYNWTGFYLGGHLGGAFSDNSTFNGLALSDSSARFMGGVQAGYDWQLSPMWVIGLEGQYSWSAATSSTRSSRAATPTTTTSAASPRSPAGSATPGARA